MFSKADATTSNLVETCRHHGLDIYNYLKYVLTHIQEADTPDQLEALLPYNVERQALVGQYQASDIQ